MRNINRIMFLVIFFSLKSIAQNNESDTIIRITEKIGPLNKVINKKCIVEDIEINADQQNDSFFSKGIIFEKLIDNISLKKHIINPQMIRIYLECDTLGNYLSSTYSCSNESDSLLVGDIIELIKKHSPYNLVYFIESKKIITKAELNILFCPHKKSHIQYSYGKNVWVKNMGIQYYNCSHSTIK